MGCHIRQKYECVRKACFELAQPICYDVYGSVRSGLQRKLVMERFVRRENVKHYRDLLLSAKTEAERQRIQVLLDEELKKQRDAGDLEEG